MRFNYRQWAGRIVNQTVNDFGGVDEPKTRSNITEKQGTKRKWLKAFETAPAQLLNVYGPAKCARMADEDVWHQLKQPTNNAEYATELASPDAERRGIGLNRWLQVMVVFCEYQLREDITKHNKIVMNETVCNELYAEIERILPSLKYCLAPKKVSLKHGTSSLRSGPEDTAGAVKEVSQLATHTKTLYEWIDVLPKSKIRMLINWQAAGGTSFVNCFDDGQTG